MPTPAPTPPPPPSPSPPEEPVVTMRCEEVIDEVAAPPSGWMTVLDAVALDGRQYPNQREGFMFSKSGLVVRAGATVDIVLPEGSPHRVQWGWSNAPATHVRIPACRGVGAVKAQAAAPDGPLDWVVFPGGFFVPEPACVELIVREGGRQDVLRVAVGKPCPEPGH